MRWSLALVAALWLWVAEGNACGGVLDPEAGVITSPNYPNLYPSYARCSWEMTPRTNKTTTYTFVFSEKKLEGCVDHLVLALIRPEGSTPAGSTKICNDHSRVHSMSVPPTYTVRISFYSDVNNNGIFRIVYFIEDPLTEHMYKSSETRATIRCLNGGTISGHECLCARGFAGTVCETACGFNLYGALCSDTCSRNLDGCRGIQFCSGLRQNETEARRYYDRRSPCSCVSGFMGSSCDEECREGTYGSNCTQHCGFCNDGGCNPITGHCQAGCLPGFHPPYCQQGLTHLVSGFEITSSSISSMAGYFHVDPRHTAGDGIVTSYEVQYKEPGYSRRWSTGVLGTLCDVQPCLINFTLDGLPSGTTLWMRILLLDENMQAYDNVQHIEVRTQGQRKVSDLVLSNVTAHGMLISWSSPFETGPFWVMYECELLQACPGVQCDSDNSRMLVAERRVQLSSLLAFATYRVTVVLDDEAQTAKATTRWAVPDTVPSDLKMTQVTNTTAVVHWAEALQCGAVNGPATSYRWELNLADDSESTPPLRTALSNSMVLVLRNLEALTNYMLRVSIVNVAGSNPDQWASLPFKTLHTVPDAPVDLTVYRLNASALWVHWQPPPKPSGKIVRYLVHTQGQGEAHSSKYTVSPTSHCVAWPDSLCFSVHGLRADVEYTITVSAFNEFGDEPGEPATIVSSTTLGVPGPPRNLRINKSSARHVVLEWQLPDHINADLSHFDVIVTARQGASGLPRTLHLNATEESLWYKLDVPGLAPGALYEVAVRCGWNGLTEVITFSTLTNE